VPHLVSLGGALPYKASNLPNGVAIMDDGVLLFNTAIILSVFADTRDIELTQWMITPVFAIEIEVFEDGEQN